MVQHRGRLETPRWAREKRVIWARIIIALSVIGLGYSLSQIQVVRAEEFAAVARENMLRPVSVRAPRGTIYDRHGRVVAENRVAYQVQLMPAPLDTLTRQIEELRPLLDITDDEIDLAFRRFRASPNHPMAVIADASLDRVARVEERRIEFPHVLIHQYPKRYYPAGAAVGHLIGYVAEISQDELQQPRFADYRQGQWIGKAGLERQYERVLGGQQGMRFLEVDARGRIQRWLPERMGVPPIPGQDIHLELDLDLQRYGAFLLQEAGRALGMDRAEGAFVAIDPRTGGVLALYSNPSYDPNLFTGGISQAIWRELQEDPTKPLLDRAAGAAQPPGSTFKMTVVAMALEEGLIRVDEFMPIACGGGLSYAGRYARCWTTHGIRMNLPMALAQSCSVYFSPVGIRLGFARFMEMGTRAGLGSRTGIDLPSEIASTFPRDADWFQRWFGYPPQPSEIMSLAIGQGAVNMTPLKLAHAVTAFARPDGRMVRPRLVQTTEPPEIQPGHSISQEEIAVIRRGMRMVMHAGGTAAMSAVAHWDVGGKTGTAQNPHGDNHAWFVGWGGPPGQEPEIVAAMLVYYGQGGSATASAPVTNAINFHLNRKYGRPFERYATPRERGRQGLPFDWTIIQRPVPDYPVTRYGVE
jgi:penicillin-binding protein 2